MSNISAIQSSGQLIQSFLKATEGGKSVELKGQEVRATPAKTGFFSRIVQRFRGETPGKINAETRTAFAEALNKAFGREVAKNALGDHRLLGKDKDKPLSSRDVREILGKAISGQNIEKLRADFQSKSVPVAENYAKLHALQEKNLENFKTIPNDALAADKTTKDLTKEGRKIASEVSSGDLRAMEQAVERYDALQSLREDMKSMKSTDK